MDWWKVNQILLFHVGLLGCFFYGYGQDIPRDTSYTVQSTLLKVRKHHPEVEVSKVVSNPSDKIRIEKEVVYRTLGERELTANVFFPGSGMKSNYPGVLIIHGGGWRTGDKSLMTPLAERMAAAGYVVVAPEYRLSLEAPYPAAVHDLKAAIRWMRANTDKYHLDTGRIAVMGCSAGGQLAALIGTTNGDPDVEGVGKPEFSSKVKAIVDIDGILAFKHPESEEGTMAAQWLGGTYEEVPKNWEHASALTHVDERTPPSLFIGSAYPRFLAGRADFIEKLDASGIKHETKLFSDAPHSFWLLHPWFEPTTEYVIKFLDHTFK